MAKRAFEALRRGSLLGVGLALCSCASRGAGDTRRELLGEWATELIVPLYAELDARAAALQAPLAVLCETPSEAALTEARQAWDAARQPLKRAEVFAFGPFSRSEYDRIGPKLDSWPAKVDRVEERIASTVDVTPEALVQAGVWLKGSPVLGYLLHSNALDADASDVLTALADNRRCEYLLSVGAEFASRSHSLHEQWDPSGGDFASELSDAGRTGTAFSSLRDAFGEIVNRMGFTLENIRSTKLGAPLGEKSGGGVQPDIVESRYSGRSVPDILNNLEGLEWLFFGDEARGFRGLSVYIKEQRADFDTEFRQGLNKSRAALNALEGTLGEALLSQPEQVQLASEELGVLERLIQSDIIGALGLTLSFNDNDGD